jgi:hypothetical protein
VVAILALRAMGEWRTIQHREPAGPEARRGNGDGSGNGAQP